VAWSGKLLDPAQGLFFRQKVVPKGLKRKSWLTLRNSGVFLEIGKTVLPGCLAVITLRGK
jgi:hypothetical protein